MFHSKKSFKREDQRKNIQPSFHSGASILTTGPQGKLPLSIWLVLLWWSSGSIGRLRRVRRVFVMVITQSSLVNLGRHLSDLKSYLFLKTSSWSTVCLIVPCRFCQMNKYKCKLSILVSLYTHVSDIPLDTLLDQKYMVLDALEWIQLSTM